MNPSMKKKMPTALYFTVEMQAVCSVVMMCSVFIKGMIK